MGEVVPARTSLTLLPPSPRTVLSLSCFKVLQCINCRDWHPRTNTFTCIYIVELLIAGINSYSASHGTD